MVEMELKLVRQTEWNKKNFKCGTEITNHSIKMLRYHWLEL